jgi:hypothetical protein
LGSVGGVLDAAAGVKLLILNIIYNEVHFWKCLVVI